MQDFFEDIVMGGVNKCKHKKLLRKKDLLWQCTRCESFFTVQIQNDDKDYFWLKSSLIKTDVEKYIESWWCRKYPDMKTPNQIIKDKICNILCDLDSKIGAIVHFNKKDIEKYVTDIKTTENFLKKWIYISHCFDEGLQNNLKVSKE